MIVSLHDPAGVVVATRSVDLAAPPSGPPVFAGSGLSLASNTTRDLAWARYGNLWGAPGTADSTYSRFIIDGSYFGANPAGNKPQMYGVDRITLRNFSIINTNAGPPPNDHVEGIHLNGCRDVVLEDGYFSNNDVFHLFLTVWGGMHSPQNLTIRRCRFDAHNGPFSIKAYDNNGVRVTYPGVQLIDCQFKPNNPVYLPSGATQTGSVQVAAGAAWPAFPDGTNWTPVV